MRNDAQNPPHTPLYGIKLISGRQVGVNLPASAEGVQGEPGDAGRKCALLVDCGVEAGLAAQLAGTRTYEQLVLHVARWLPDQEAGRAGVGALAHRIAAGAPGRAGLSAEQLRHGILANHVTPADVRGWGYRSSDPLAPHNLEDIPEELRRYVRS